MEKSRILQFWRQFFTDLFLGTFKNLFLFSIAGSIGGILTLLIFKGIVLADLDWDEWVKTLLLLSGLLWFGGFGVFHAWIFAVARITGKKVY